MLMTEKSAAKKRCTVSLPALIAYAMDADRATGQTINSPVPLSTYTCIGSQCAHWSWYDYADDQGQTWRKKDGELYARGRAKGLLQELGNIERVPARGYCGLTGSK